MFDYEPPINDIIGLTGLRAKLLTQWADRLATIVQALSEETPQVHVG
jgi:hypothetical protein